MAAVAGSSGREWRNLMWAGPRAAPHRGWTALSVGGGRRGATPNHRTRDRTVAAVRVGRVLEPGPETGFTSRFRGCCHPGNEGARCPWFPSGRHGSGGLRCRLVGLMPIRCGTDTSHRHRLKEGLPQPARRPLSWRPLPDPSDSGVIVQCSTNGAPVTLDWYWVPGGNGRRSTIVNRPQRPAATPWKNPGTARWEWHPGQWARCDPRPPNGFVSSGPDGTGRTPRPVPSRVPHAREPIP